MTLQCKCVYIYTHIELYIVFKCTRVCVYVCALLMSLTNETWLWILPQTKVMVTFAVCPGLPHFLMNS